VNSKCVRFTQRKANFLKSLRLLENQSNNLVVDDQNIGATLHFFEMTFELGWKLLKDLLEVEGVLVKSPREALKTAFQLDFIKEGHIWLVMLDARNSIAHAYDEQVALELFQEIRNSFLIHLTSLKELKCSD
jgi:nucleotidyltransferase substrate binding protein (TIGR01987 family)